VGVAVFVRVGVAVGLGNSIDVLPGIADQVSYHLLATRVLTGHGFTFAEFWWPFTQPNQPTAHWSYLYTLWLTGWYAAVGVWPIVPRLIQAIAAGVLMPGLIFRIANRVFTVSGAPPTASLPGLLAAGWTAVYGYFVYYSGALITEAFYLITVLWVLECSLRIIEAGQPGQRSRAERLWIELGLAITITGLLRQVFLLFVPFLFLWFVWAWKPEKWNWRELRDTLGYTIRHGVTVAAILAFGILPITFFNYTRFNRLVLLNTNSGFAFFWSNHPIYGDHFIDILPATLGTYQDLIPADLRSFNEADLDAALLQRGWQNVAADPARYIRLSLSRVPILFEFWPAPDSSLLSNLTRVGSFGLALPFMLAGIVVWSIGCVQKTLNWRMGGLLLLFAVVYSAVHLLSWSLIRYRVPVDAALLPFAALAGSVIVARLVSAPQKLQSA
jgi:hypothetical protein